MTRVLLLLGLLAILAFPLVVRWFLRTPPERIAQYLRRTGVILALGLLLFLTLTGRLSWLFALAGALIAAAARLLPLLRYLPLLQRLWNRLQPQSARAAGGSTASSRSTVEAHFVRMSLDHDTGEMRGEVLEGRFKGKWLHTLTLNELIDLFQECREADEESATLVKAYLDRIHGEGWQERVHSRTGYQARAERGSMTPEEAYQVLGLTPSASQAEIIEAHRRLMQKFHPDRGGSDYLAAKINQAKDVLLGK
jgi:DnaJ-domain-containing protein 1